MIGHRAALLLSVCALTLSGCGLKPQPLTPEAISSYAGDKLARYGQGEEPVTGAIGLDEAIARGLRYNLDYRVEAFQSALRTADLEVADFHLLPNVVASSNYLGRNNNLAAYSQSVTSDQVTLIPSVSTPKNDLISDLTLSYNTLDFGLSYIRAKQAADEVLIAEESKRKVTNRIVQDVRTAYWRAYSSQRLSSRLRQLEVRVRGAVKDSRTIATDLNSSPVAALTYERELLEIERQAQAIESEMSVAKAQLAALMNVAPEIDFTLSGRTHSVHSPLFKEHLDRLIDIALVNRPELRETQYKSRINSREALAALLEVLPSANLYFGANNDTSQYLFHGNWLAYGARASWNLINVFKYPAHVQQVNAQEGLIDAKALAVTMAIITQVQVARIRLFESERELKISRDVLDVQNRLMAQIKAQAATEKASEQALIREQMNTLVAESRRDISYAAYENAYGLVFEAIGLDPYDQGIDDHTSVKDIARVLESNWIDGSKRLAAAQTALPNLQVAAIDAPKTQAPPVQAAQMQADATPAGGFAAAPMQSGLPDVGLPRFSLPSMDLAK